MKMMRKEESGPIRRGPADALTKRKHRVLFVGFLIGMLTGLLTGALTGTPSGTRVYAAFPPDIAKNPLTAVPLYEAPEQIEYYADASRAFLRGTVDKDKLVLEINQVEGDSVRGLFEKDGQQGTAWFAMKDFVSEPDFEHEYYTIRSPMNVYTDGSRDQKQTVLRKYAGVIVVGDEGDSRQVIYKKRKHPGYGLGWMSEDALSDTLVYDGREKQALSDGIYDFRCGCQDDSKGGTPLEKQPGILRYHPLRWELIHVSQDRYRIRDPYTDLYLTVDSRDHGLTYGVRWKKTGSESTRLFRLRRAEGSFIIQSLNSSLYLSREGEQGLTLMRFPIGSSCNWRITAPSRMLDETSPMVFTQYDPQWCGTPYGGGGCMGTAGCGVLATVNAVYALSGQYMDVMELADYAVEKGYRIVGSGTDDGIFKSAAKRYGQKYNFTWDGHGGSIRELKKKLKQGDTAVVHVQGHYVAIVAYDKKKKKFLMLDSNYLPKREDTAFGDWISAKRLMEGALEAQEFYYYKLKDPTEVPANAPEKSAGTLSGPPSIPGKNP